MTSVQRVLVVDDDAAIRGLVAAVLRRKSLTVDEAVNGREAIDRLEQQVYAAVVVDLMMPIVSGFEVVDYLQEKRPTTPCVVVISAAAPAVIRTVEEKPVVRAVLRKPFDIYELVTAVLQCVNS